MKKLIFFILIIFTIFQFAQEISCGQYDSQLNALFSQTQNGEGTYYGNYNSGGSCTLDPTPPSGLSVDKTVAINSPQYFGASSCGMCLQVTGNGKGSGSDPIDGTFIVFVNNICPECATGDLDLGENGDGRWEIEWVAVECPGEMGAIEYMGQGANEFYLKLQVRNYRIPVSEVKVKEGGGFKTLTRTDDNFFISSGDLTFPLSDPLQIRIISIQGEVLDDQVTIANVKSGKPFKSSNGVQFTTQGGETTDLSTATTDYSTNYVTTDYSTNENYYYTSDYYYSSGSSIDYTSLSSTSFTSIFTSDYSSASSFAYSFSLLFYIICFFY